MKHRQQMAIALSEIGSPNPSFLTKLFELIAKADYVNKPRLRSAFTAEVDFFDEWYSRPDGPAWLGRVARGEEE